MNYTTSKLLRMFADEYDRVGSEWFKSFKAFSRVNKWQICATPSTLVSHAVTNPKSIRPRSKTIIVNGVEVPEPIRNSPNEEEIVYACLPQFNQIVRMKFEIVDIDKSMFLENGYLHYDVESAKKHVAAINECDVEDVQVG